MRLVKVAAGQLNQTPLDWETNRKNIADAISQAKSEDVSVLCLPELCITGYGCEDAFLSPGVRRTAWDILHKIAPLADGIVVSVGLPLEYRGAIYDAAALLADGQVHGFACKRNLAGEGIHYEPRWFKPWPTGERHSMRIDDQDYWLGDQIFQCDDLLLGFEICEDAWVAERPGVALAAQGVDLILNPSASHFAFGKQKVRERFVVEGSRAFHVAYLYSNLVGNEAGRAIYDGGGLIASAGELVGAGSRFSYQNASIVTAVVDVDQNRLARAKTPNYRPVIDDVHPPLSIPFRLPEATWESQTLETPSWQNADDLRQEEFTRAIALALFDYLRKSRSLGFVVSLSGGADSAAVAVLAASAVQFGLAELGFQAIQERLSYIQAAREAKVGDDLVHALLVCVYQSTRNSSSVTRDAARTVAESLSSQFLEFDVDNLVHSYISMVEQAIGRQLDWGSDDLALQNIQARTRGPGVWLLANLKGALLLSTSNRSEAAVGYATMDGDTCGGLAPVAGIDKKFLRDWLVWMEENGPWGGVRLPGLSAVNAQQPTAELRPPAQGQTDEADLMPYPILDEIERAAIRDKRMPREVFRLLQANHPDESAPQLYDWVRRFFQLWSRNQWKRERYAPSFHLDDENLDPKTWCRFPILSGGFRWELEALEREVQELQQGGRPS